MPVVWCISQDQHVQGVALREWSFFSGFIVRRLLYIFWIQNRAHCAYIVSHAAYNLLQPSRSLLVC